MSEPCAYMLSRIKHLTKKKRKGAKDRSPGPHRLLEGLEIRASPYKHWVVPLWVKHQKPALTATKHRCRNAFLRHPSGTHTGNSCVHMRPGREQWSPQTRGQHQRHNRGERGSTARGGEAPGREGGPRPLRGPLTRRGALVMHS